MELAHPASVQHTYDRVKVTILGGALPSEPHSIGPQCFVVDYFKSDTKSVGKRIMIDCGTAFYNDMSKDPCGFGYGPDLSKLLHDGKKIDALFLTHGHGDHIGYVPALFRHALFEPEGIICGSRQTLSMAEILWEKSDKHNTPHFSFVDFCSASTRLRIIPAPGIIDVSRVADGISAYVRPNGHVQGSMSITLKLPSGKNILFMGDCSWHDQASVKGGPHMDTWEADWIPDVIMGTDCTYALSDTPDVMSHARKRELLTQTIVDRYREGKSVIVLAFAHSKGPNAAIDVAQRGIPCYLDGLSRRVYEDILRGPQWSEFDVIPPALGEESGIEKIENFRHRGELIDSGKPVVIFTTHGMGQFGPALEYYEHLLPRKDVCFITTCSYLPPEVNAARLQEVVDSGSPHPQFSFVGYNERKITVDVAAEILKIGPSAHGSFSDLLHFLNTGVAIRKGKKYDLIVASHGSREGLERAAREFRSLSDQPTVVGTPGTVIDLC